MFDAAGKRYFDATAGLWYCNVGHGRAEIADAAAAQMRDLAAYNNYGDLTTRPASELAERARRPGAGPRQQGVLRERRLGCDRLRRQARAPLLERLGQPEKTVLLSRRNAYHGVNGFGTSIGGIDPNRAGFGPLLPIWSRSTGTRPRRSRRQSTRSEPSA